MSGNEKKEEKDADPIWVYMCGKEKWVVKGCGSFMAVTLLQQRKGNTRANN